jgi:hypothetical protein
VYLADLKNQTSILRLLLESVEAELSQQRERVALTDTTHAWLPSLRRRLAEVEKIGPRHSRSVSRSSSSLSSRYRSATKTTGAPESR